MPDIYDRFRETVDSHRMIRTGDRILLSLSAGKDSMAMLDLMMRYREETDFETAVFHLNHLTRGIDSDNDEMMVKDKALKLGIAFYGRSYNFNDNRKKRTSFEEQARDVRYRMLEDICSSGGYNKIATAHNLTDNAETILMRIFSGTGLYGLRGISHVNGKTIRPVLDITPEAIYSYLRERSIEWREDRTNEESDYRRNYVRNMVLPLVTEKFPDAIDNIITLAGHAAENESLLAFLAEEVFPGSVVETDNGHFIYTDKFTDNIPFIKYLLSRLLHSQYGVKLNSSIYNEIVKRYLISKTNMILYINDAIIIEKTLIKSRTGILVKEPGTLVTVPDIWEYNVEPGECRSLFIPELNQYLNYRKTAYSEFCGMKGERGYIFISLPEEIHSLKLRNRRAGDRIHLEKGVKKIKELMIEKKLDINTKKSVPLLVVNDEIAAYLPGAVKLYPDRVSCNFWVRDCSDNMFLFFFSDEPVFDKL